jgi:polysaccharide deacetylase 2 family uncharacterized protein YibQ
MVALIWGLTLLLGGVLGMALQGFYRAHVMDGAEGSGALAAAPYQVREDGPKTRERRAAIIIDDLGLDLGVARKFCELELPITLAILPYQRHSLEIAREALRHGKEVLLHLPLQPKEYPAVNPGTGALLSSMDRETVQAEVAQQLDSLPHCVGVSSHMGSYFTEQPEPMKWVLAVVGERRLFFVDSLTTPNSVAGAVARDYGVPFARRTHFLDAEKTEHSIIRRLCRLVDTAALKGGAIGIAHPSEEVLAALPKVGAAFCEKGVRLVPVSEMATSYQGSSVKGMRAGAEPRSLVPDP